MKNENRQLKIKQEQLLVSITTTRRSDWRAKIKEIDRLSIKKAALFLTCLKVGEKQQLYKLLEATGLKEVPFVHIRSDMPPEELAYLAKKWKTKAFNTHTLREYPLQYDLSKFSRKIFIENVFLGLSEQELKGFAGICLDFTHLENDRLNKLPRYEQTIALLEKYPIGCNHISAIQKNPFRFIEQTKYGLRDEFRYDKHSFSRLSDFDYLKSYPAYYFSPYCALELENPLSDQLKAVDYIYQLLSTNYQL